MTQEELQQENEKLTARLKKAVDVFNEQKATIARQAEEIESLKQKAAEGEKKDNEFFEQVNEIEQLKSTISSITEERDKALERIEKAGTAYKKLQEERDLILDESAKRQDKLDRIEKILMEG